MLTAVLLPAACCLLRAARFFITAGYACMAIPKNCGTTPNSPCCPSTYRTSYHPRLARSHCPKDFFCQYDKVNGPKYPNSELAGELTGVCLRNAPDCGKLNKPCCISNGGSNTATTCEPGGGRKGYCVTADGKEDGMEKDLICKLKPAAASG
jgi:hypothetical protein